MTVIVTYTYTYIHTKMLHFYAATPYINFYTWQEDCYVQWYPLYLNLLGPEVVLNFEIKQY